MYHLNSQSTVFETSLPFFKSIGTEHQQQLQSSDLIRHAFLPHLASANPLISAFPSQFLAFRAMLHALFSSRVAGALFLFSLVS